LPKIGLEQLYVDKSIADGIIEYRFKTHGVVRQKRLTYTEQAYGSSLTAVEPWFQVINNVKVRI
jgi:hypothetical protein